MTLLKWVSIGCLCSCFYVLTAQTPVEQIRKIYYSATEQIASCEQDPESADCPLYQNTIELNTRQRSWPGVGTFSKKITFWYSYAPDLCDGCEDRPLLPLTRVIVEETSAVRTYYREYTYSLGVLVFCFWKLPGDSGPEEERYYLQDQSLVKYLGAAAGGHFSEVLEESEELCGLFLRLHQVER